MVIGFENSQMAVFADGSGHVSSVSDGRKSRSRRRLIIGGGGVRLKGDNVRKSNHLE